MKKVGRILLIICAILILSVYLPSLIISIIELNKTGWNGFLEDPVKLNHLATVISAGFSTLVGGSALLSAILGRAFLFLNLFSFIMLGITIWKLYAAITGGLMGDWVNIVVTITGIAVPILYVSGTFLIKFNK